MAIIGVIGRIMKIENDQRFEIYVGLTTRVNYGSAITRAKVIRDNLSN